MGEGGGGRIGVDSIIGVEAKEAPKPKENENPYADSEFVALTPVVENGDAQKKVEATLELKNNLHKMYVDLLMSDAGRGFNEAGIRMALEEAQKVLSFSESQNEKSTILEYIRNIGENLSTGLRTLEQSNVRRLDPDENRKKAQEIKNLRDTVSMVETFVDGFESPEQKIAA